MYESNSAFDEPEAVVREFPDDRAVGLLLDAEDDDIDLASAAPAIPLTAAPGALPGAPDAEPAPEFHLPQLGDVKQQVSETTNRAVGKAKETAAQAFELAKRQAYDQLTEQKNRASESIGGIRQTFERVGGALEETGQPAIAEYSRALGENVDRAAAYLRNSDVEQLGRDAHEFAQKNPVLIIGGAFLLGIALARFFKSSESNVRSDALVPIYSLPNASGTQRIAARGDYDSDSAFDIGARPISAHGYVPGGVLGGASS